MGAYSNCFADFLFVSSLERDDVGKRSVQA
ncbi:hypothetical protein MCBRY_003866 [Methylocystis bryophila]